MPARPRVKKIHGMSGEAIANGGDVGDREQRYEMVKQAMDALGRLDAVVCNAGILRDIALHNMTEQDWDMVLRVHLKQCYNILHHAWPVFRQPAYRRVVMATSAAGLVGNFGQANYRAAKAGMFGLMNVAKIEGAKCNVMVNLVSPIAITRMTEGLVGGDTMDEQRRQSMAPEHVVPAVTFMASPQCTQSGMVMEAGGGNYASSFMVRTQGVSFDPSEPKDADWIESHLDELTNMDGTSVLWGIGETRKDHYAK